MTRSKPRADGLLIISPGAGMLDASTEAKLRKEYADHLIVEFDPKLEIEDLVGPRAPVVVAGGDGTIESVVRRLAASKHPIGILPLGTYNNLARALRLPVSLAAAIRVTREGRARAITLGSVNGHLFVEACAVGLFGEAIGLGESAKELAFGDVLAKLGEVIEARPFQYELSGDLEGEGRAMSLVFSNAGSIGTKLSLSAISPLDPYLELSLDAGRTRAGILTRAVASALRPERREDTVDRLFRFRKLSVKTRPRVRVYADNMPVGRTPADVAARVGAIKVLLPPPRARR